MTGNPEDEKVQKVEDLEPEKDAADQVKGGPIYHGGGGGAGYGGGGGAG